MKPAAVVALISVGTLGIAGAGYAVGASHIGEKTARLATVAAPPTTAGDAALCGAPANPYGYNLCGVGGNVTEPPSDICDYFKCIDSFWSGDGYMVHCNDDTYSMSGGDRGACSWHDGEGAAVSDPSVLNVTKAPPLTFAPIPTDPPPTLPPCPRGSVVLSLAPLQATQVTQNDDPNYWNLSQSATVRNGTTAPISVIGAQLGINATPDPTNPYMPPLVPLTLSPNPDPTDVPPGGTVTVVGTYDDVASGTKPTVDNPTLSVFWADGATIGPGCSPPSVR